MSTGLNWKDKKMGVNKHSTGPNLAPPGSHRTKPHRARNIRLCTLLYVFLSVGLCHKTNCTAKWYRKLIESPRASKKWFMSPCLKKVEKHCCRRFGWVRRALLERWVDPGGFRWNDYWHLIAGRITIYLGSGKLRNAECTKSATDKVRNIRHGTFLTLPFANRSSRSG